MLPDGREPRNISTRVFHRRSRQISRTPRSPATCFGAGWWRRPNCPRRRRDRAGCRVPSVNVEWKGAYRLVAYHVPGTDGSIDPGHAIRSVRPPFPRSSGNPSRPRAATLARSVAECGAMGQRAGRCFGTPIAEHVPTRLIAGHVALLGDAAHVSSPMTGSGFHCALLDVLGGRRRRRGGRAGAGAV
jgi:hypothetical protein